MMFIGIDSAENMRYSGIVSGSSQDIDDIYKDFVQIFRKHGVKPPFHWRKIRRKVKNSCRKEIVRTVNNGRLKTNIFAHKRKFGLERKILFYELLPQHISLRVSAWVKELAGSLEIEVDDDYNVRGRQNATERFVRSFIESLCFILTGKEIHARKEKGKFKATIKQKKGVLRLYGRVCDSRNSKSIQIADLILGYYIQSKCRSFDRNVVHFWRVLKK